MRMSDKIKKESKAIWEDIEKILKMVPKADMSSIKRYLAYEVFDYSSVKSIDDGVENKGGLPQARRAAWLEHRETVLEIVADLPNLHPALASFLSLGKSSSSAAAPAAAPKPKAPSSTAKPHGSFSENLLGPDTEVIFTVEIQLSMADFPHADAWLDEIRGIADVRILGTTFSWSEPDSDPSSKPSS